MYMIRESKEVHGKCLPRGVVPLESRGIANSRLITSNWHRTFMITNWLAVFTREVLWLIIFTTLGNNWGQLSCLGFCTLHQRDAISLQHNTSCCRFKQLTYIENGLWKCTYRFAFFCLDVHFGGIVEDNVHILIKALWQSERLIKLDALYWNSATHYNNPFDSHWCILVQPDLDPVFLQKYYVVSHINEIGDIMNTFWRNSNIRLMACVITLLTLAPPPPCPPRNDITNPL